MTIFWIIAAAFALLAPLFVAVPLLTYRSASAVAGSDTATKLSVYRDHLDELDEDRRAGRLSDDQYRQARSDLEDRLLEEAPDAAQPKVPEPPRRHRAAAVAASLAVPLFAFGLYLALGNPGALRPQPKDATHGLGEQQMDAMIARLAARLEKNPQDPKGWAMLARAQTVLGRFGEASAAYAKSVALFPDDAQLLADYADVLAMTQGRQLRGEPEKLIERALHSDPDNAKALALAGTAAFDHKDFVLAVKHWEKLRDLIPPGSEFAKSVQEGIDEAKKLSLANSAKRVATNGPADAQATARR